MDEDPFMSDQDQSVESRDADYYDPFLDDSANAASTIDSQDSQ